MPHPEHHPTIDIEFMLLQLQKSPRTEVYGRRGAVSYFIKKGVRPIGNRFFIIPDRVDGQLPFEYCAALAYKFKFLDELNTWLEINRNWKEGAYFVPQPNKAPSADTGEKKQPE